MMSKDCCWLKQYFCCQIYSEFHLRRPENLIIFIRTEDDLKRLKRVKEELSKEKKVLEVERDEEKVDLVMKYHSEDEDCLLAGKPLKNFDLKISTVIPFDTLGIRLVDSFVEYFVCI